MSSFRSRSGGSTHVDDVQPVEQILAEPSLLHRLLQIDVRGRDDADIDLDDFHAAEAHELALLHHAQQLGLRLERNVADLVEEDAALVGEVEEPLLRIHRSGERALHVAEERRFQQVGRQVAGVHRHERAILPLRVRVNGAGDELFAGAALALNEDRRSARRRLNDQVEHAPHRRAAPDDVVEVAVLLLDVLPQRAVFVDQAAALERVLDDDEHFVVLERLGDVVERAALHRGDGVLDRRVRRHHDDRQLVVQLLQRLERRHAVDAGHHHVDDGRVERDVAGELDAFLAAGRQPHGIALALQQGLEDLAHDFFVVDYENRAVFLHNLTSIPGRARTRGRASMPAATR